MSPIIAPNCVLCGSKSVIPLLFTTPITRKREFFRCGNCDLIFVSSRYHLLPDDEASRYRLHHNSLSNEGYVQTFLDKIALVNQYCRNIKTVLDYGCGPEPILAELLRREGFDCNIYDPNFFPEVPRSSYDLVISTEVFEHLRDISGEIVRIRALLDRGGYLAIMTSFHDPVKNIENWWYLSDPTHICFFGSLTFHWLADKFGFSIIYSNNINFIILQTK